MIISDLLTHKSLHLLQLYNFTGHLNLSDSADVYFLLMTYCFNLSNILMYQIQPSIYLRQEHDSHCCNVFSRKRGEWASSWSQTGFSSWRHQILLNSWSVLFGAKYQLTPGGILKKRSFQTNVLLYQTFSWYGRSLWDFIGRIEIWTQACLVS